MPRKKDPMKGFVLVSMDVFDSIMKRFGNINGELKIREEGEEVKYYVEKKFLLNRKTKE
jgi:hypothetical protein